jgi:hypothetical protein
MTILRQGATSQWTDGQAVGEDLQQAFATLSMPGMGLLPGLPGARLSVARERCFLSAGVALPGAQDQPGPTLTVVGFDALFGAALRRMIHVPALRGNPERTYAVTAVGRQFPGTFDRYAASVIANWTDRDDQGRLSQLGAFLQQLGLTWKVAPRRVDDASVELRVGRLIAPKRGGARDLVGIADVGFAVSQVLPLLVAILTASPGQLVYVEQPEIHLHPRSQTALGAVLAEAVGRRVPLVVETHSALLLRSIQTQIAKGLLRNTDVSLQWFERDAQGYTRIRPAHPDRSGAFGDWPVDFDDTSLEADRSYLDAVEALSRSSDEPGAGE